MNSEEGSASDTDTEDSGEDPSTVAEVTVAAVVAAEADEVAGAAVVELREVAGAAVAVLAAEVAAGAGMPTDKGGESWDATA